MKARIFIAVGILFLLNGYTVWRIIDRLPIFSNPLVLIGTITVFMVVLQLAAPLGERLFFPKIKKTPAIRLLLCIILWAAYLAFGTVACLFVYSIIADIIAFAIQLSDASIRPDTLNHIIMTGLIGVTVLTTMTGILQARMSPAIRKIEIILPGLPGAFDGFTIAQISDLHVGATIGPGFVQRAVGVANSLKPDIVVVTGDLADGRPDDLRDFLMPLSTLQSRDGSYYITGNHEYYWGAAAWMEEARKFGLKVLANQHVVITRGVDKIVLAGVTDISSAHFPGNIVSSPAKSLQHAPDGTVKILLAHQPVSYVEAQPAGFDLQISGHTHGGQFFPFNFLIGFFQRYARGLHRFKNMQIYVSTGTGYWGPPLRTGVRSEISLLTLRTSDIKNHAERQ